MAYYTVDLRQIIYHFSQDLTPFTTQKDIGGYKFVDASLLPSISDRIEVARDRILSKNIPWFSDTMKKEFWELFAERNLMREIEYETTDMFILELNSNIKSCIKRYNITYETLNKKLDPFTQYEEIIERDKTTDGETSDTSNSSANSDSKTVYEDTPINRLTNADYATNITTVDSNSSGYAESDGTNHVVEDEDITRKGRRDSQAKLIEELLSSLRDVISDMVNECSQRIFLKIYE